VSLIKEKKMRKRCIQSKTLAHYKNWAIWTVSNLWDTG